jgi:hypothetical protein
MLGEERLQCLRTRGGRRGTMQQLPRVLNIERPTYANLNR